jgi:hypothetical protein
LIEHIIAVGLSVLAEGRPKDQQHIIGSSLRTYVAFDEFVDATNSAQELSIKMPQTPRQWDSIYQNYKKKSTNDIMA